MLAGAIAKAGVDPSLAGVLPDAPIAATADRRGSVDESVDHAGWVVTMLLPGGADLLRPHAQRRARPVPGLVDVPRAGDRAVHGPKARNLDRGPFRTTLP
jgi:hypothetical protein